MRKNKIYPKYSIEEKNEIVKKYLNGEIGYRQVRRVYNLPSSGTLCEWVKKYKQYGSVTDNRGKSSSGKGNYTRKKKLIPEEMTKEELIEYVNAVEDIKKLMVYLTQQKKNIK